MKAVKKEIEKSGFLGFGKKKEFVHDFIEKEFDMGSPLDEKGRYDDEGPVHHVKLASAFYLGKYEVTQKQWRDVMGTNPSSFKGDDLPVENISWDDVQQFIKKLMRKKV